jgi:transposase
VRSAPTAELVPPSCYRPATAKPCSFTSTRSPPRSHAILILDQAGWHGAKELRIPTNISLLPLPPRSPELNSQENIWQFMRQNWLSNRIFKSFDDIVDHCCYAWNTLVDQPWKIMSIAQREWAAVGHSF